MARQATIDRKTKKTDIKIRLEIDDHHTVKDLGICLGRVIKKALGKKKGIRRYGEAIIPMDEVLARVAMGISNRPNLSIVFLLTVQLPGHSTWVW